MAGCADGHDYVYYGALNVYDGAELVKVVDAWRCRRCGVLRVGVRGPEVLGSSEGMLPELEPGKHWVLFACKHGQTPCIEILQLKDIDQITHKCSEIEETFRYVKGGGVFHGMDGPLSASCYAFELQKILRGYVDLSKKPPEVITLLK